MPGPYDIDPRQSNAPAGYVGLRGGQGHPGMYLGAEEVGVHGMMPYAAVYPGVYPQGPNISHSSVPPQYASHESMPGYAHGMGGARNGDLCAPHPTRPPPPSTTSSSSGSKSRSRPLPSAIQAAIDEAIQKSAEAADKSGDPLGRSKTSPATVTKDISSDGWGDGIDTCICTKNCKDCKGERAVKWYEGTAKIGGEEIPVRAKLNTRYVLKDDIGKDCGDHTRCKKKVSSGSSSSSSSSNSETSKSKKNKKRSKKKTKKPESIDALDDLQAELERMKQAAAMKQGGPYGPSPFTGYSPGTIEGYDPEMMKRMIGLRDTYGIGRMAGMDPTGKMQGIYDPMTTRNPRLPRMPPKPGMQMRSQNDGFMGVHKSMGGASPLNPYARPSVVRSKGKNPDSMPPRRRPRFGLRRDPNSDSEPSTSNRSRDGKKRGPLGGRTCALELDDTDVSLDQKRRSAMRGFCSDRGGEPAMCNLPKPSDGEKNGSTSQRDGWLRTNPSVRRGDR
ncbi:hypothetical protein E8E12_001400 [Didymella heteroderae]|uniref:Uncharacterized protein n=1 Tax=Didymella heteroderae TaxID=1769908 RepID=A0A9P5BVS3_9PLEO|nr:hypothetical protein E8E12_001400 [Didymella heteroderae]